MHSSSGSSVGAQAWDPSKVSATSSPSTVTLSVNTLPGKRNSGIIAGTYGSNQTEESNIRQWSYAAFEWLVRDVHKLRDFVETSELPEHTAEAGDVLESGAEGFEILKESPMLGDGKFKLEIAKLSQPYTAENNEADPPFSGRTGFSTLALYITSLMVDYAHSDYEMQASIFVAIKCQDDRLGERGARTEWAWENWQNSWVFRQESEVWECPLPSLSSLLENPRIKETDSFVICVQIHSPVGPFYPQQPSAYYVPRDLLEGLEASLDNPNTGDVQFICLERMNTQAALSSTSPSSPTIPLPSGRRSASSQSSSVPQIVARKRVIYAHSDILNRRSEYFATMLNSSFSENASNVLVPGERKVYTIVVEEADFTTVYWMLKWIYANWLLFRKDDDPREAVDGIGAGWSARNLNSAGTADEWEWKTIHNGVSSESHSQGPLSDTRSVTSAESARSGPPNLAGTPRGKEKQTVAGGQHSPTMRTTPSTGSRATSSSKPPPTLSPTRTTSTSTRRSGPSVPGSTSAMGVSPIVNQPSPPRGPQAIQVPRSPSGGNFTASHHPLSPHAPRHRGSSRVDPHSHPTTPPQPASALCMYQLAHRYAMPGLAALALEHIMSTITPHSSFGVLLATSTWDELHSLVEDYVVDKWEDVSVSDEFEQCCEEVASGEWGPEGGRTLMALFRRLRSPNAMAFTRN
ncbi:hypothetical protein CERSUDRAFT_80584 [Gelatoporia subvermispora B]|uniref:BTB domain-containing protein n=1 Tax=Ceriporiopsis subvermispora (strain B) TaxID=914234 RepID=M2RR74_CERS8|nr:hypothetical protein CERSUDRAFT_80584 [Gelatoporia subvermispora B]